MDVYMRDNRALARRRTGFAHARGFVPAAMRMVRLGNRLNRGIRKLPIRSRFDRNVGVGFKRRGGPAGGSVKRARTYIGDPSSYKQLTSTKRRYGKKVPTLTRQMRLLKTVTVPYRLRFGKVQDINAATGTYWLTQNNVDANTVSMPVYILNMTNVTQSGGADATNNAAYKMWELRVNSTLGQYNWAPVYGVSPSNGTTPRYSAYPVPPSEGVNDSLGRKALLDWTRLKLCIWGKTQNPTNIRIRIVQFLDEEFCPENYMPRGTGVSVAFPSKVAEYWNGALKYLLNGHMGGYSRFDRSKYVRTLKTFTVNLNPIDAGAETVNSDPRPHMKHIDIFQRWNRMCDFTDRASAYPQTLADLKNVNCTEPAAQTFGGYLTRNEKNIYCIIESVQPAEPDAGLSAVTPRPAPAATGLSASFDLLLEQNYSKMERNI